MKQMTKAGRYIVVAVGVVVAASTLAMAAPEQAARQSDPWCNDGGGSRDRARFCEVREVAVPASGNQIRVDAGPNGGVAVEAAARQDILVRARVEAQATDNVRAQALASQVQILTAGGDIRPQGPQTGSNESWSVSFRLAVPATQSLSLKANNGGISIAGIISQVEFKTTNGGVSINNVGGHVKGQTTNGGITIALQGTRWDGQGLDVETSNGGVKLELPAQYAAHLEARTVNGGLNVDFPVTMQGQHNGRELNTDINGGGPTIRVVTTNGGVNVRRR